MYTGRLSSWQDLDFTIEGGYFLCLCRGTIAQSKDRSLVVEQHMFCLAKKKSPVQSPKFPAEGSQLM